VLARVSEKPNVPFVWRAKITRLFNLTFIGTRESLRLFVLKNVRWEKIKIQKRWLWVGCLMVLPLLYVYYCRSFLLCRLLGLQVTFWGFAQWRISEHKTVNQHGT